MTGAELIKKAELSGHKGQLVKSAAGILKEALWGKTLAGGLIAAPLIWSKYRGDVRDAEMRGYALAQQRLLPFLSAMNAPQGNLSVPHISGVSSPQQLSTGG